MKFKVAVFVSVVFHLSLFAIALYVPGKSGSSETVYRVDLIRLPGGGGSGGKANTTNGQLMEQEPQRMKDLTTKKEEHQSKLRFPDKKNKKKSTRKKDTPRKKKNLISVVKKKTPQKDNKSISVTRKTGSGSELRTGLSTGSGGGSGGGFGSGTGSGTGSGIGSGNFPYAYYIETLRSKISNSWYKAVVSPGQRGRHVATVYFRIHRNGQVSNIELKERSGISTLDLSSVRAIENAAPFPPLPRDYTDRYLGVYFEFVWEKK